MMFTSDQSHEPAEDTPSEALLFSSRERREQEAEEIRQEFVRNSQKLPDPAKRKTIIERMPPL